MFWEPTTRSRGLLWLNGINLTVLLGFMFFGTHDLKSWAALVERYKSDGFNGLYSTAGNLS